MAAPNPPSYVSESPSFGENLGLDMVDIFVGPSRKPFRVHKARLCSTVPYFNRLFNGGFKDATEQWAELPEEDCDAFNLFLEWLYVRHIPDLDIVTHDKYKVSDPHKSPFMHRIKLYCFAERYLISDLMDIVMTVLIANYKLHARIPGCSYVDYIYHHTSMGSLLRRFSASSIRFITLARDDESSGGVFHTEDLTDLMSNNKDLLFDVLKLMRSSDGDVLPDPYEIDPCQYHVHEDGRCVAKNATAAIK